MSRTKAVFMAVFCSLGLSAVLGSTGALAGPPWGPETPNFNLEIILRSIDGGSGFGHVKFRQPNDAEKVAYLDTWVRDLMPNHSYLLQRAVDTILDGNCTSNAWLTLGKGLTAQAITTDDTGRATEQLFRNLAALPTGSRDDMHFRLIDADTSAAVLESGCYEFTVDE